MRISPPKWNWCAPWVQFRSSSTWPVMSFRPAGGGDAERIEAAVVAGQAVAAGRGANHEVRRSGQRGRDAGVKAQADRVEVRIGVCKDLVEVAHAEGELVAERSGKNAVVDQREVVDMDRRVFEIRSELRFEGACCVPWPINQRVEMWSLLVGLASNLITPLKL